MNSKLSEHFETPFFGNQEYNAFVNELLNRMYSEARGIKHGSEEYDKQTEDDDSTLTCGTKSDFYGNRYRISGQFKDEKKALEMQKIFVKLAQEEKAWSKERRDENKKRNDECSPLGKIDAWLEKWFGWMKNWS